MTAQPPTGRTGVAVGDPAPDFELDGIERGTPGRYRLSDHLGEPVVLVFYPADDTPVCTRQLISYTEGIDRLAALGATLWAISPQSVESHEHFAAAHGGFAFPLLSDPDRVVGAAFGILGMLDLYRRSTFVVDAEGVVTYAHRYLGAGLSYKPLDELVAALG